MIFKILIEGEPTIEFSLSEEDFHNCSYLYTPVKEFHIKRFIKSEKDTKFEDIKKQIDLIPVGSTIIIELWEEKINNLVFTIYGEFKEVLTRIQLYSNPEGAHMEEDFSIRLFRDQQFTIDKKNNNLYCDNSCIHLKDDMCTLYNKKLNFINDKRIICSHCFSDSGNRIYISLVKDEYNKLIKNYINFSNLKNEK